MCDGEFQWIAALRSGEYKQFHHFLRHKAAYCCLGVLCDVYDKNMWLDRSYRFKTVTFSLELSRDFLKEIGLDHHHMNQLITRNDEYGYNFADIEEYRKWADEQG